MTVAQDVVKYATAQVGKPYVWGGIGPNGFDCSGLVYAAFKAAGHPFRFRTTVTTLLPMGSEIAKQDLQPGDLVFPSRLHVQIYVGNGQIVEAPRPGVNVRVDKMWTFWRARRIVPLATPSDNNATDVSLPLPGFGVAPYLPGVGDAVDTAQELFNAYSAWTGVFRWSSDPRNWGRIGYILLGFVLILVALIGADKAAKSAAQITGKVVKNV